MAQQGPDAQSPIAQDFSRKLFIICALIFTSGLTLTAIVLFLQIEQPTGSSYGEHFSILAALRKDLLIKSLIIYAFSVVLISIGIVILTLLYSHRVVGPIYRLQMVTRQVASGDFTQNAFLRQKDVIWPLAEELNGFITTHRQTLVSLKKTVGDLKESSSLLDGQQAGQDTGATLEKMTARAQEVDAIIQKLSL